MTPFKTLSVLALAILPLAVTPAVAQDGGEATEVASTPGEKLSEAQQALRDIRDISDYVGELLTGVKEGEQPVQVKCLNKKVASLKTLTEITESASLSMQESMAEGNDGRADHEYRKVGVALSKAKQLRAEAEACLGEDGAPETTIEVNESETEGSDDVDSGNTDIGSDPPDVSPYQ